MKPLALLFAFLIIAIGAVLVVAPDRVMMARPYLLTPIGLYGIGALRVGMGLVLIAVATASRTPRALRVLGVVLVVAGLMTPVVGVERTEHIADWAMAQGSRLRWGVAAMLMGLGSFIVFAVAGGRRAARSD
ncbi:MAG: hypothetical protein EPO35_08630 [Acidobacteria bacterium]|nr:MAG: hypothetical protein EPO35_08630 [Acidobacteriota bacterium]